MLPVFVKLFRFFWEREKFVHFSENVKYGHLKKKNVIHYNEEKRVTI